MSALPRLQQVIVIASLVLGCWSIKPDKGMIHKIVCDPDIFYRPYARVQITRKEESTVLQLTRWGFLDLRTYSGLLCLNGPVTVFRGMEANETFTKPEFGIYIHECLIFNRRSIGESSTIPMTEDTVIHGEKIFGINLMTADNDYRRPIRYSGIDPREIVCEENDIVDLNNKPDPPRSRRSAAAHNDAHLNPSTWMFTSVPGGKLIMGRNKTLKVDSKSYCFHTEAIEGILYDAIVVMRPKMAVSDSVICKIKIPYESENQLFANVIKNNLTVDQITWYDCKSKDIDEHIPQEEKVDPVKVDFDMTAFQDFRTMPFRTLKSKGSKGKKPLPGYPGMPQPKMKMPELPLKERLLHPGTCFQNEAGCPPGQEYISSEETAIKPDEAIRWMIIYARDCAVPPKVPVCTAGENDCELIWHTMHIKEVNWEAEPDPIRVKEEGKPAMVAGNWRKHILNLINAIFHKICPQVSNQLAPAAARVVEYYLDEKANDKKADESPFAPQFDKDWSLYIKDLAQCWKIVNARNKSMMFTQSVEEELPPSSVPENPYSCLSDSEEHSYKGQIKKQTHRYYAVLEENGYKYPITHYTEAAEMDYDFNFAIDAHWRIVATVLGYCNSKYVSKKPENMMRMYSWYTEDIFDIIQDKWLNINDGDGDNSIFDQILGEFKRGPSSIWLKNCMEAAYIHSESTVYRPLRPVPLREGEIRSKVVDPKTGLPMPGVSAATDDTKAANHFFGVVPN